MLVAQLRLALCNPLDCRSSGSSVHEFSRQEYWSGLPFPSPGDLPNPGIEPRSSTLWVDFFTISRDKNTKVNRAIVNKFVVKSISKVAF